MRRRVALIAVGLALWLAGLSVAAQAVMLRYTPKVGAKVSYDETQTSTTDATMAGKPVHSQTTMHMTVTYTVKAKAPKGVRAEMAMRNASMSMTMPGAKQPMTQKMPDTTTAMVIDERGHIEREKTGGKGPQAMGAGDDPLTAVIGFSLLPNKEVKPGETWTDTLESKSAGMAPGMKVTFTSRLVELTTYQGRRCAKLNTTLKGTISGGMGPGTIQGQGTEYYDYENSVWMGGEAKMTMTMKFSAPQGKGPGGSMVTKITGTMKLRK